MADATSRGKQVLVEDSLELPPGFRFHPTDEEIIIHYLLKKVTIPGFTSRAMGDVDLNMWEPSELPKMAKLREEWYFFCQNNWKYPTGTRANRATKEGYWKATGKDKEIYSEGGIMVGLKKTLVFYSGRAPRGEKTDWVIHEFRLADTSRQLVPTSRTTKCEWVVCKVFQKSTAGTRTNPEQVETVPGMNSSSDDSVPLDLGVASSYQILNVPNSCRPNSSFANNAEASSSRGPPRNNIWSMGMDQMPNYCYSDANSHEEDDPYMFIFQSPPLLPVLKLDNLTYLHPEHAVAYPAATFAYVPNDLQNVNQLIRGRNNETSWAGNVDLGGASLAGHLTFPGKWKR